jgi:hypothetical protein
LEGLFGTGKIEFKSAKNPFPIEFISLDKPVGKAYNCSEGKYVDVTKVAIKYGKDGIHAYPVKDW